MCKLLLVPFPNLEMEKRQRCWCVEKKKVVGYRWHKYCCFPRCRVPACWSCLSCSLTHGTLWLGQTQVWWSSSCRCRPSPFQFQLCFSQIWEEKERECSDWAEEVGKEMTKEDMSTQFWKDYLRFVTWHPKYAWPVLVTIRFLRSWEREETLNM